MIPSFIVIEYILERIMIIVKHIKLSCYECAFIAYSYRIDRSENGDKRLENDYFYDNRTRYPVKRRNPNKS